MSENSESQAKAQLELIREMVQALEKNAAESLYEEALEAIQEDPLSIEVRSGWYVLGREEPTPKEYKILLSWGGPATQIVGSLDEYGQPKTAILQHQDWFEPWTDLQISSADEEVLLKYASCFWYGN